MKCSDIEEKLNAYIEGFLQKEEKDMVEEHCSECSDCRDSLESLQKARDILGRLDEIEPPLWLTQKIMSRIHEKEEAKNWFRRFFLPLRVKIPIQALAMIFVAVLSVCIYRSTTPEMGHLSQRRQEPRVFEPGNFSDKAGTAQGAGEIIKEVPELKEKKPAPPAGKAGALPAKDVPGSSGPGNKDNVSGIGPGNGDVPPAMEKSTAFGAIGKEDPRLAAPPPLRARTERFKMRGMPAREEKGFDEFPIASSEVSQEEPDHITVTAEDPSLITSKARRIMTILAAQEIRERTENDSMIISCLIDPGSVPELKNRIAVIAPVMESRTKLTQGQSVPQFIEVRILKDSRDP